MPVALNVWQQVEWGALPGQADHHRLGSRAYRVCVARADEAPWIRAICGPKAAIWARVFALRWPGWRLRDCWAFTPTSPAPFQPILRRLSNAAIRRHRAYRPTKGARTN